MIQSTHFPTEHDFGPWGGNLDAQSAWSHFGGLTLDQARERFRENPLYYQEDFMFMGGGAFAFYFPVIDDYLRGAPENNEGDDRQAWILAQAIKHQFSGDNLQHVQCLVPRVVALADFVRENIARLGSDAVECHQIARVWTEVVDQVESLGE
jgi:hypothetical protein